MNVTGLLGFDFAPQFRQQVADALASSVSTLAPSFSDAVKQGHKAMYNATLNMFLISPTGQIEILLSLTGAPVDGSNTFGIQAALQHLFSQGRIYIASDDPFTPPGIDPPYL